MNLFRFMQFFNKYLKKIIFITDPTLVMLIMNL